MTWSDPPRKKHPLLNLYLIKLGQERGQVYHTFLKQQKFHPTSGETFTQQLVGKRSLENIHGDRIGYKIGRINGWGLQHPACVGSGGGDCNPTVAGAAGGGCFAGSCMAVLASFGAAISTSTRVKR